MMPQLKHFSDQLSKTCDFYTTDGNVEWLGKSTHVILNSRMPSETKEQIIRTLNKNCFSGNGKDHCLPEESVVLQTSGSTTPITPLGKSAQTKLVVLSKSAFLASAAAVNKHFSISAEDRWLQVLPRFHVGGLAIYARAFLSKSPVVESSLIENKWDVHTFLRELTQAKATLVSLVPTQIFDLCSHDLSPPEDLRAVIVGGSKLSASLYRRARQLGWPIYPSFGATELCSQIATAPYSMTFDPTSCEWTGRSVAPLVSADRALLDFKFPDLELLPHIECQVEATGRLLFRGPSLFSGYIFVSSSPEWGESMNADGWFASEDFGSLNEKTLRINGRGADYLKIGGEAVSLIELNEIFEIARDRTRFVYDCSLLSLADDRLGEKIVLAVACPMEYWPTEQQDENDTKPTDLRKTAQASIENLVACYNSNVLPVAKIREVICINKIPRSPLGKVLREELKTLCSKNSSKSGSRKLY